ncbi:MAG: fimbrial protein, partial [Bacteriovoracaceae bacterium]|nr:fimbrial protein [Bacteriovoracaceae bacterium]
ATTGDLLLQGVVDDVLSIEVTPTADATDLDIVAGESALLVATVEEKSNDLDGYTVKMSSTNGGKLVHGTDATKSTTYQISYDGAAPQAPATTDSTVKVSGALAGLTTDTSNVNVSVDAYAQAPAGTYSDTVTFTIEAN